MRGAHGAAGSEMCRFIWVLPGVFMLKASEEVNQSFCSPQCFPVDVQ